MITSFEDVHQALAKYWQPGKPSGHGAKHRQSLDFMREMMAYLGNPQDGLKVIHVAGTSGKTSTAYYIAALLKASVKKVGLTISPHVDEVNERVQINLHPLPEAEFCKAFDDFLKRIQAGGFAPNYFELFIAFAFCEFARQKVDYAVVEVGIGGLLDSTNIATRGDKVCVITDIGFDHTAVLGNTLAKIAEQKAGIIQQGNVAFCYAQPSDVMQSFSKRARQKRATLNSLSLTEQATEFGFLPLFQQRNFGLARKAVEYILELEAEYLSEAAVNKAAITVVPGRMEIYKIGTKTLVLDGAHNPQKIQALLSSTAQLFGETKMGILFCMSPSPHDLAGNLAVLANYDSHVTVTGLDGDLMNASDKRGIIPPEKAFKILLSKPEKVLLVCGSFYLLSRIRSFL